MFVEIFFTLLLVLALYTLYQCWVKPRRIMKFYETQLSGMKYKAKIMPYKPFYNRFSTPIMESQKTGDPLLHYKTEFVQYGIVISNVMNKPCIEISHIDFMRDFYSVDKHYEYPKFKLIAAPFIKVFGRDVGMSQGNLWKQKRILMNKLFNFDFVKMQTSKIVSICDQRIKQMELKAIKGEDQNGRYVQCFLLEDLFSKIFSTVIYTGFFGLVERHEIDGIQVPQYLVQTVEDIGSHRLLSPTIILGDKFYDLQLRKIDKDINQRLKKLNAWGKKITEDLTQKIQNQLKEKDKKIIIDNIFKAFIVHKKQNNISDDIISFQDIFSQFIGSVFAGTDSTTNYANVMLFYIAQNPEVEKKLRQQIEQYLNDDYSFENLRNFKYIDAIQKQTTRIYGPANSILVRQAAKDNYLNGLAVKKGTLISVIFTGSHYSEQYFKQPKKFRPERWLNGECDNLDPYVLLGFNAGARSCLGKHLAMLQTKIALIKIMKRYKKITLMKQNFKWQVKIFVSPEHFDTRLTINDEEAVAK